MSLSDRWRFSSEVWKDISSHLQPPDGDVSAFVKDYLERHVDMALSDEHWFHEIKAKDHVADAEKAIKLIEDFSYKIFGNLNPKAAVCVREQFDKAVENFRDWPDQDGPYMPFGESLLSSLREAHTVAQEALRNLDEVRLPTGQNESCATARDIVLAASLQAYRRVHGKIPHAQNLDEKASKFDWFIKKFTDTYTQSNGLKPYPWGTIKGRVNVLRKHVLPQTPINYYCL